MVGRGTFFNLCPTCLAMTGTLCNSAFAHMSEDVPTDYSHRIIDVNILSAVASMTSMITSLIQSVQTDNRQITVKPYVTLAHCCYIASALLVCASSPAVS